MKRIQVFLFLAFFGLLGAWAQGVKPLPSLHVEGKWLVDTHGNHVVLHGVMDTPSIYFNGGRWGDWSTGVGYDANGATKCVAYFEKLFVGLEEAKCNVFRLHLDPAWTNDNAYNYPVAVNQSEEWTQEANIRHFNPTRLTTFMKSVYVPIMMKAMKHGMYVVVRPPGVCPGQLRVSDYYQQYLMQVWDLVTQNDSIRKYSGQISIELANEPVSIKNSQGVDDKKAMHDYFQPIVDMIRANGFTGVIWVPGMGWQSNYADYKTYPITGYNIGYAVHDYDGWYGCADKNLTAANLEQAKKNKISKFREQVPVVDTNPIIITEVDWSPKKPGSGHYNEHGEWVESNYGTWATGRTSMWGAVFKAVHDYYGNISMTLSGTACLIDIDVLLKDKKVVPAFDGLEEACGKACMDWYAEYYEKNYPKADFKSVPVSSFGTKFQNPIVRADFPDPDVIRVGDTYYMVSTTMHHFPGATILKSQDLVNWEYCAHPLVQTSSDSGYNLISNKNAYGSGMWACSMKYHNGKFHILINEKRPVDGWQLQGWLLTATNPEGHWEVKKLSRSYYDPGMLFDNGKVYVAQGIGNISVCELDEKFNFKQEKKVISDKDGLEGCHFYKKGDYYYIYATYGGWPSGQAVFRSKNVFGPYEEKMLFEKWYDNKANTIHQGALIEDTQGKWWTVLQEDLGAMGRMPNLQPVRWADDWPVLGNNGKPYESFVSKIAGPKGVGDISVKYLPTTDVFRTYPLGMQWEWNHKPDNTAWSLFERPGWLRLRPANITSKLPQSRGMLTQRIFAVKDHYTNGSIRLDVSKLTEGDRAGICILQDPYAMIAVEMKDGQLQLVWQQDKVTDAGSDFKADEKREALQLPDSIIYLRASMKYGENKAVFSYSLDNKEWKRFGGETAMTFNLTVFVGARFGLFCQATKSKGGYADFDWFTTEADFDEAQIYPETFTAPTESSATATKLTITPTVLETMVGDWREPIVKATFADKKDQLVGNVSTFVPEQDGIVDFYQGRMLGIDQGSTKVNATYVDLLGNKFEASFTAKSSYFPFDYQYVRKDITGDNAGTYRYNPTASMPVLMKFTEANGEMGWVYNNDVDMSAYKYLVIQFAQRQAAGAHLNIYTTQNLKGASYSSEAFENSMETVINLQEAKYTSTTSKGKAVNLKKVRMVTFSTPNVNKSLFIKDMFLSNDEEKYGTGIVSVMPSQPASGCQGTFDLQGRRVERPSTPGLYIVNGRKVVWNGR